MFYLLSKNEASIRTVAGLCTLTNCATIISKDTNDVTIFDANIENSNFVCKFIVRCTCVRTPDIQYDRRNWSAADTHGCAEPKNTFDNSSTFSF